MRRTPTQRVRPCSRSRHCVSSAQCLWAKVRREFGVAEVNWDEWPEKGIKRPVGGTRFQPIGEKGREVASAGATVRDTSRPSSAQ